jgi:Cu-Zn family superoxide dismutase
VDWVQTLGYAGASMRTTPYDLVLLDLMLPDGHGIDFLKKLRQTGNCTPVQTENETGSVKYFSNAYGHLNPDKKSHGFLDDNGPHAGDLPNFIVDSSNNAFGHIYNNRITIKDDNKNSGKAVLLDDDGAAIIIHSGQDDYATQPTGAAGSRIACGVIKAE